MLVTVDHSITETRSMFLGIADIISYIMDPGEAIRTHREQLCLSQRSLARRSGLTQATISKIESGLVAPNWETVRALLLAMGLEPGLQARRLRGRWDPLHLAASRRRSPAERLQLAMSANRLAGRLRQAGEVARGGS
jgi:transcriptional regulator with XRE-family HTH domain